MEKYTEYLFFMTTFLYVNFFFNLGQKHVQPCTTDKTVIKQTEPPLGNISWPFSPIPPFLKEQGRNHCRSKRSLKGWGAGGYLVKIQTSETVVKHTFSLFPGKLWTRAASCRRGRVWSGPGGRGWAPAPPPALTAAMCRQRLEKKVYIKIGIKEFSPSF